MISHVSIQSFHDTSMRRITKAINYFISRGDWLSRCGRSIDSDRWTMPTDLVPLAQVRMWSWRCGVVAAPTRDPKALL